MERIGLAAGYDPSMTPRDLAAAFRAAEERGFEVGFFSETIELVRDSVTSLAAIGLGTQSMTLGCTQIVRLRTPLVMAQSLAALDELTGGRMMMAPGACTNTHAKRHGLHEASPPQTLVEWVESIRAILSGETVSYHSEHVHFDEVKLSFSPTRTHVPLFIPATSKTGLQIAGRIGDGVLLNATCSPEYSANAIKIVRQAAEEAGRDWSTFQIWQIINTSVEDDHRKALDAIRWEIASKLDPIQLPFIIKPKKVVGEPYMQEEDIPMFQEAWDRGGKQALIEAVPDSYVEGLTASGTPDEVVKRVQQYRDVGVQVPLLRPAAPHQVDRILELFSPS
ncbi:MAG TPA: LLM class flavin-dependent oxidoreductase [Actinomycetota bacterium]|nr:LLM class flavin-dependent oxidoreductase [Actinomycetota bacterium]